MPVRCLLVDDEPPARERLRALLGEAEAVVEDLSDLFRYALQASKDSGMATLGAEVKAVRRYLSVEHARYRGRLIAEINVPEDLRPAPVPSMTVQPLVENAVKHGVGNRRAGQRDAFAPGPRYGAGLRFDRPVRRIGRGIRSRERPGAAGALLWRSRADEATSTGN